MVRSRRFSALSHGLLPILAAAPVTAISDSDIWSLSLEELLQVKVVTASKSSLTVEQAPAVMSVISAEEIAAFGANNLHDILRRVAGIHPVNGAVLRDNLVSIRGQHSGTIDRRVLLLIDGRPYRDGQAGGVNENFYRAFPISAIEKIEIIRGPSSILYGSSATSGVINVVTRKDSHNELIAFAGSFGTSAGEFSGAGSHEKLSWQVNGKYLYSEGWPYKSVDYSRVFESEDLSNQDRSVQAGITFGDFSASIFSSKIDDVIFDSSLRLMWPSDRYVKKQDVYSFGYKTELKTAWSLDLSATHNVHDRRTSDGAVDIEAETTLIEAGIDGKLNEQLSLVTGIYYQALSGNDFSNSSMAATWDQMWGSVYYQLRYEPTEALDFTFGQHFNSIENESSLSDEKNRHEDVSSRIALGWKFLEGYKLKMLWSEAYRSPYGGELSFQTFLRGNPELEPEKVDTKEIQLLYAQKRWSASVNVFRAVYEDEIVIVPRGDGVPGLTYENEGDFKIKGGELEFAYDPLKRVRISGSYSIQQDKTTKTSRDTTRISEEMYKLGFAYQASEGVKLGVFDSYFSKPPVDTREGVTTVSNPEAEGYHHLSVNLSMDLEKLFHANSLHGLQVSLYGDNLLEKDAPYQPDMSAREFNTLPARPGRSWYLKFLYAF